ncbi:MAG: hypothetical protein JOY71_13745 [Acetobacteraceae bacterium]|nr:hypothetical protein [Acetobacteraceae bacterium]MBV8523165.1 hypothetical protein [Acetobacteraceae bacterium]
MSMSLGPIGIALVLLAALPASARTLEVGPGKTYAQPSQAAAAAHDGDRVVIARGEYFDCAVWPQNHLVIEGESAAGTVITDKTCQGKALFVIPGNDVTVRNLTLTRARVPDANGAGIRAEGRNLLVEHVRFINNQDGILTTNQPQGSLIIRDSEFTRNGTCEQACAHGIYAGHLGLLRIERTTFRDTREGHHIKSRALRTEVIGSDIADGPEGTASYLIDIPNGGSVIVQNNKMEKGPKAQNHTAAIMIGAEGVEQPTREILVEGNEFRLDGNYPTTFVYNMTATEAVLRGNRLVGQQIQPLHGDGTVSAGRS